MTHKLAVITGSNGGIGQALVARFRANNWSVLGLDVHVAPVASATVDAYLQCDLARLVADVAYRDDRMSRMRAAAAGLGALQSLINNAAYQIVKPVEQLTIADWNTTLQVNLLAPFLLVQAWLSELTENRGSVLNMGSIHVKATKPEFVAYATSKAAIVGMTQAMAVELGGRVRVNALCPAAVATPMLVAGFAANPAGLSELDACHPAGRVAQPDEVARAALHLCDPEIPFQTGSVLYLDGGVGSRLHDPV